MLLMQIFIFEEVCILNVKKTMVSRIGPIIYWIEILRLPRIAAKASGVYKLLQKWNIYVDKIFSVNLQFKYALYYALVINDFISMLTLCYISNVICTRIELYLY